MRHRLGASLWAAALLVAGGFFLAVGTSNAAFAYSGAQAEAQSDPVADPYNFPSIQLCCKKKKWQRRPAHPGPGPYPDDEDPQTGFFARVSCGGPGHGAWRDGESRHGSRRDGSRRGDSNRDESSGDEPSYDDRGGDDWGSDDRGYDDRGSDRRRRGSYGSIAEALEHVGEGGRIRVRPGAACDITGLTIARGVTIESEDYIYGARAELTSDECATIAPGYASSTVSFRGVDINGCLVVERGRLDFNEVNLASRGSGDAVRINSGTFSSTDSTIRARGTAINAVHALMVSLTGGGFASGARAEQVVRLDADRANLQNTLIKGGAVGLVIGMQGRYPVSLSRVQVTRGEANEIYQIGPGKTGILVGGASPGDDLPSLPNLPGASLSIDGGVIAGFADGLVFGPGTRGLARGINIAYVGRGIVAAAGAAVDLRENHLTHIKAVGIDLAAGAVGSASFNEIDCERGECVCYGGECTSRSDREFGRGAFRMSGTRCRD